MTTPLYDTIGKRYAETRRPEPAVREALRGALADARTVLNVGAGSGSYEPADRAVVALEPSPTMIRQRHALGAPVVRGVAEALPFADHTFDAAMAILTIHHWPDLAGGLAELARVARDRVVLFTRDPAHALFWLTDDYFPAIAALDAAVFPSLATLARHLGPPRVDPVPIPHDCRDGFLAAYWRRPERYLDPVARAGISAFSRIADPGPGLARLADDLETGRWRARHGDLLERPELDLGYRILTFVLPFNDRFARGARGSRR